MALTPDQQRRMRVRRMNLLMAYASFASSKAVAWTPAELFAQGEQGVWYDPSDMTTLFQDAAGTTPVTAVEQPVGLMLDKSGRGNHASQSTSASRPVLSARVNLLTRTEEFDNAAWTNLTNATVSSTSETTAPNGTMTAYKFTDNATSGSHRVSQAASASFAVPYTLLIRMKKATQRYAFIHLRGYNGGNWYSIVVDLDTGLVTSSDTSGTPNGSNIITRDSISEWCSVSITSTNVSGGPPAVILGTAGSATPSFSNGFPTYAGTGTSIYIWGADLRVTNDGVNLPAYQRVVTATDYDTTGFPMYLRFDGTDDSMATGTINPGSVDKAQVFAGARKLSDAAAAILVELSSTTTANAGTFYLTAPEYTGAAGDFIFKSRGSLNAGVATPGAFVSPTTKVLAGLGDIAGSVGTLRINGVGYATTTSSQGTGNYGSYPLYIGRRGGSSLPFNGHLYSLVVRFSATNLPDATIAQTETWVNGKTGAY